ncbi:MAG: hypothetical protein QM530_02460 [Phycisphaerales bacterium]|nr:hypothetical protein [Phycisphaerales bacterium]
MQESDVKFIDATDWNSLDWLNTGGTRSKRVLQAPEDGEWYFKCSEKKPAKEGKPASHFQLVRYLLSSSYKEDLLKSSKFLEVWDDIEITKIINNIDDVLPREWSDFCIPKHRKALMIKLLSLRTQKLKQLFNEGI